MSTALGAALDSQCFGSRRVTAFLLQDKLPDYMMPGAMGTARRLAAQP